MKMTMEYAIVDIETTGGNAGGSRITEIAIIIHDGKQVTDRFETLVNPEKEIPLPIFALTGINNNMVRDAPVFDAVAEKIYALLNNRVFVAHNVNFDYSFVRHQLEEAGYKWTARKLCTVRAVRKIRPGLPSYSLGNLCNSLNIILQNRHRAGGDADATAVLFARLLEWDTEGQIAKMIKKTATDQRLPPNLPPEDFEKLPEKPGVYYFYNQVREVVYVGKAVNLKKRVASHFSGHKTTPQRQNFLRDIHAITYEVCATELIALLLECIEIKKLWPLYNRSLKKFEAKYRLYSYEARNGYRYLAIGKLGKFQDSIEVFHSQYEGITLLQNISRQFEIDQNFCKYGTSAEGEMFHTTSSENVQNVEENNEKVALAINFVRNNRPTFAIIEKGRTPEEQSCIWVENGHFFGMGYIPYEIGITDIQEVKDYLTAYKSNQYIMQLLYSYAQKYPGKVFYQKRQSHKLKAQ
ncbi:exonuclease domain-containing protein [Flavobacterium rhizosphaerae]|uniref:Exonuclease domain-containing protein n=1 Tax=Flavobacterium rhizosphaerae TaxID=3163298 RepID=A0ABW8Z2B0_9FLAO